MLDKSNIFGILCYEHIEYSLYGIAVSAVIELLFISELMRCRGARVHQGVDSSRTPSHLSFLYRVAAGHGDDITMLIMMDFDTGGRWDLFERLSVDVFSLCARR